MKTRSRVKTSTASRTQKPTLAQQADRHDLYQRAVQCVEAEIDFVDATFKSLRKRKAVRLREDFCGTANTSCEWVRRRPTNIAFGFDLDQPTLDWGVAHNLSRLKPSQRDRVHLRKTDVLVPHPDLKGTLDVILAMNFSYWIFKDRATMLRYFKRVREDLASDGVFFLDFYGGYDAHRELKERRPIPHASKAEPSMCGFNSPFVYIWDQSSYNPITGDMSCKIHFNLPDGSKLRDAFTYDWRLWSITEIRDLLAEAGFKKSTVYWEGDDEKNPGEGNGEFTASEQGEACASWICYLTAEK
jgi:hypothetical protein